MSTIVAQIAPQRSTQYTALAETLAPQELMLSPLGRYIQEVRSIQLDHQAFLQFDLPAEPSEEQAHELGMLAMTHMFFVRYERLGGIEGPLLRPIETHREFALPPTLMTARRYRGKTSEQFTHFMCNVARFSSGVANHPWSSLRVFDPLAGGGTTLFTALTLGASAAGVEQKSQDVETSAAFLRRFMREQGVSCKEKRERFKGVGQRWVFTIGKDQAQQCLLASGDTAESPTLIAGFRPHLIVGDLPYGIQHQGELAALLSRGLPLWASLLPPSGALALAWDARRFPRSEMIALVESVSPLAVLNHAPYDALSHRVDRVIKQRDVLVARLASVLDREKPEGSPSTD
jgi:hypothetical protein